MCIENEKKKKSSHIENVRRAMQVDFVFSKISYFIDIRYKSR